MQEQELEYGFVFAAMFDAENDRRSGGLAGTKARDGKPLGSEGLRLRGTFVSFIACQITVILRRSFCLLIVDVWDVILILLKREARYPSRDNKATRVVICRAWNPRCPPSVAIPTPSREAHNPI